MKPHIVDFLKYLESKGEKKVPLVAKLLYPDKFSPITEEDLTVKGDLDLSYTEIEFLPNNLKVEGDLHVAESPIEYLPDNLTVGGDLDLTYTYIASIPDNLKVGGGYLFIAGTPLARRLTKDEIKQEIEQKGGYVKGSIGLW